MPLKLKDKEVVVKELNGIALNSISAAAAHYRGLTVAEMTQLRVSARNAGVIIRIFRNTLARRALEGTDFACLTDALVGPTILLFAQEEPGAAARVLRDFVKAHEKLEVRGLALDGQLLGADQLKAVASLPSRDEALALLMSAMQAPITQFVRTVKEPYAQAVRAMAAVRDEKAKAA